MRSIVMLCVAAAISGCGGDDESTNPGTGTVASVRIDPSSLVLQPGESFVLTASARDNGGRVITGRSVTWSSSAQSIATVEPSGVVRAVAPGTAQIAATLDDKTTSLTLVVIPLIQAMSITPGTPRLEIGSTTPLRASFFDGNNQPINIVLAVTWESGNETIATVSPNGTLTAVAPGIALITASVSTSLTSARTASTAATVIAPVQVVRVDLLPAVNGMIEGQTRIMTAFPRDATGSAVLGRAITWGTTTPSLLSVNSTGAITAITPGSAEVTGTTSDITGRAPVTIFSSVTPPSLGVGFGLEQFASVPAGSVYMLLPSGDSVLVSVAAFRMQRTELTRAQWQSIMGSLPAGQSGCSACPVANITYAAAQQFVQQLNAANPGAGFRIPTPPEWEFAARADATGQHPGELEMIAHYFPFSDSHVWPVALKLPNGFGLYDVIGNVAEWATSQTSKGGAFMSTAFTAGVRDPDEGAGGPVRDITRIGLRLVRN